MPPLWLIKAGGVLSVLAATFGAGWAGHAYKAHRDELAEQLQQSETNRESDRLAARNMTRISDALTKDRLATDRHAAGLERRLRDLAAQTSPAPGCPSGDDDPRPAAALLPEATRGDLVALIQEADAVADRLRSCQPALKVGDVPAVP